MSDIADKGLQRFMVNFWESFMPVQKRGRSILRIWDVTLSLKSAKQPTYEMAYECLRTMIIQEYERHSYILAGDILSEKNKERYRDILIS